MMRADSLGFGAMPASRAARAYHLFVISLRQRVIAVPPLLFDAALALFLWGVGAAQLLNENGAFGGRREPRGGPGGGPGGPSQGPAGPDTYSYILLGLCAGSLVVRRRYPLLSLAGVTTFGAAFLSRGEPVFTVQLIVMVAMYTAVADSELPRWQAIGVCLISAAVLAFGLYFNDDDINSATWAMNAAWVIAAIFLGDSVRSRREYALQAEQSREEAARRVESEQRLQLARELHDVVGHSIALINVQAGAGAHVLHNDPAQAKEAFENIRSASHETLQELRSLVGVLREPVGGEPQLEPTVGLDALDQLIKGISDAGQYVKLHVSGRRRRLTGVVDFSAYRILQEALTNTVRHAPRSEVDVSVDYGESSVSLEVRNDRGQPNGAREPGGGHGLMGMRERATAIGGRLEAGPQADGGFLVRAVLPLVTP